MTDNYFIIIEQPLNISVPASVIGRIQNKCIATALQYYENEKVQINLIERSSGRVSHIFFANSFCYFHVINQYEFNNHVVLDLCTYPDGDMLNDLYIEKLKSMTTKTSTQAIFGSEAMRYVLPLQPLENSTDNLVRIPNTKAEAWYSPNGKIFVQPEKLSHLHCELPTINYNCVTGKPYRYFYAVSTKGNSIGIIKVNVIMKTEETWYEDKCYLSEPIYVAHPNAKSEDDGVVIASMLWRDVQQKVGLLVLDAQSFEEIGRAEFTTTTNIPRNLHGWFVSKKL